MEVVKSVDEQNCSSPDAYISSNAKFKKHTVGSGKHGENRKLLELWMGKNIRLRISFPCKQFK